MADSQRKTAQLFDYSAITTGYRIQWTTGNDYPDVTAVRSDYIPVSSGTYSCSDSVIVLGYDDSKNYLGATDGNGVFEKIAKNPISQFIIPTNSLCKYVKILAFDSSAPMNIDAETMLNTGSTALPYEPYGWLHSLRKLTTATDTITTLPIGLYADGTNATVGLVGNMYQESGASPTTPIQPQECGDLETEGAKAGQYKIPILSANITTPVYLGEVETTRKIRKYEFTGQETINSATDSITETGTRVFVYRYRDLGMDDICDFSSQMNQITYPQFFCSHFFEKTEDLDYFDAIKNGECGANSQTLGSKNLFLIFASNEYKTNENFKAYLAAQYAAGTPVTVWYVLAEPETGIVNEPIRKIGEYADTVSGITIPTITGKDTFDVLTTLKPSEVELTYTGWHDATVEEWNGSQWQ